MKYTFTRTGRMVVRPTAEDHPDDAALAAALSWRAFARRAGVRSAATGMRRAGYPLHVTLHVLLHNPVTGAALLRSTRRKAPGDRG